MKKTGASTGSVELSARARRKRARQRAAEEAAWVEQNGPTIIRIGDHEIYVKSQARRDIAAARRILLAAIAADAPPGLVNDEVAGAGPRPT